MIPSNKTWKVFDAAAAINCTYHFFSLLCVIKLITSDTLYSLSSKQFINNLLNKAFPSLIKK